MKYTLTALAFTLVMFAAASCAEDDDSGGGDGGGDSVPICTPPAGPQGPLPGDFASLDSNFQAEAVVTGLNMPVKIAQAPEPDGRLFVSLLGGEIITIEPDSPYTQTSWATVAVLNGSEQGLLGIAVHPDFATNGWVYVMACVTGASGDVQQIIRYTDSGGVGTNPQVIVDNLPTANIHNAGGIAFGNDGKLFVSVGDAANSANSQTDGSLAGRILRFNDDGSVPADNPFSAPDEYEWCRGMRNSFGITVHRGSGILVGTENGPNSDDELNYLAGGKNFEWENATGIPGGQIGVAIRNWPTVIVPTGLTYHTGAHMPAGYADNLFICSYEDEEILRFVMDGSPPVNIDSEHVFAEFVTSGNSNKPLDIIEGNDGSLYVTTFTDVWRIHCRGNP